MTDPSSEQSTPVTETPPAPPVAAPLPRVMNDNVAVPPHTQTESTLAPTAEFTRIFLLAWIIRYIFRGGSSIAFNKAIEETGPRASIINALSAPGRWFHNTFFKKVPLEDMKEIAYAASIGLGSGALSYSYSRMVKRDIQNIFCEAVAYEKNTTPDKITFNDIQNSNNQIVRRTVQNYHTKFWERLAGDSLFFGAAALRFGALTDTLLGVKGVQIFADTWKRKTTMFEDLISFINNKINPRNGLGQPIGAGEIFDLYQHYAEAYQPDRMFNNVVERGTGEGARWADSQPIFQRITELMNHTYAYKHRAVIDPNTGHAIHQANFPLPKFIYLLGHNLIDVKDPALTLTAIEIANRYGMEEVKTMQSMLQQGRSLADVTKRYPIPERAPDGKAAEDEKNAVIAKGSTMQLEHAETHTSSSEVAAARSTNPTKIPLSAIRKIQHDVPHAVSGVMHDGTVTPAQHLLSQPL